MGFLSKLMGGGAKAPVAPTGLQLGQETIDVQKQYLPALTQLQQQYNPQLAQNAISQTGRMQQGLSPITANIAGDVSRDRGILNQGDIEQLRSQSAGFAGAESLQAMLQKQAEEELALGGSLSAEQERDVSQGSQAASFQRGRGVGNFSVGQMALERFDAQEAIKNRRRSFAAGTAGLGLEVSNPFQRIMSQNANAAGGIGSRLANAQGFAGQNSVNFDPISGQVANAAQNRFASEQANFEADRGLLPDLLSGGLSLAGSIFGGPAGGMAAGALGSLFGGGKSGGGGGQALSNNMKPNVAINPFK